MSKTLSVIVPTLNEGGVIGDLLQTLQSLRSLDCELIVADGGSIDSTCEQAAPLVDGLVVAAAGRALQMNAGAARAQGEWLWFVHADTRLCGDAGAYLALIEQSARDWGRFDVRLDADGPVLRLVGAMMNWRSRLTGIATGDQGLFVRRRLFESMGGFAPIPLMEDIDLSRRLRRRQWPACPGRVLGTSARRWQRHGVLRTIALMWRLRLAYFLGADPARLAGTYRQCSTPTHES